MKKIIVLLLLLLVGCSESSDMNSDVEMGMEIPGVSVKYIERKNPGKKLIVIPEPFVAASIKEDLDRFKQETGISSAMIRSDGSLYMLVPKKKHHEMLQQFRNKVIADLQQLERDQELSSIRRIYFDEHFTELDVTVDPSVYEDSFESFEFFKTIADIEYLKILEDNEVDDIVVRYIDVATNEVYKSATFFDED